MVRLLAHRDIAQIKSLWQRSIENSETDIDIFFRYYPKPIGIVEEENKIITAFFFMLPCVYDAILNMPCWVIYKYVASEASDRQENFDRMLQEAERQANMQGIKAIIASPRSEKMWNRFALNGYQIFSRKKVVIQEPTAANNDLKLTGIKPHTLSTMRKTMYGNRGIIWPLNYNRLSVDEHNNRNGNTYFFTMNNVIGTIVGYEQHNILFVEELTAIIKHSGKIQRIDIQEITDGLCSAINVKAVSYALPEKINLDGSMIDYALIKSNSINYSINNYIYLGLN